MMVSRMRGVVLPGDGSARVEYFSVPEPGSGEVLVKVEASGICGSDIGYIYYGYKSYSGVSGPAYRGVIAGHEPAGRIVSVGPNCRRFRVGDRVLLYHIVGCGRCANCRSGYYVSCSSPTRSAYGWQRHGGHADYCLAAERTCILLPENLSYTDGALISCGVGTAHQGLRRCGVSGSDDLLVIGLGPVGLAAAMVGRVLGASRIYGVETSAKRREWAVGLGLFDRVVSAEGLSERVQALGELEELTSGKGCSVVIECSGSTAGRSVAIANAAEWGRISLVGEGGRLETEVSDLLLHKQVTLYASWVTSLQDMESLSLLLSRWEVHPERIVSDRFGLDDAAKAYAMAAGESAGKVVLIP